MLYLVNEMSSSLVLGAIVVQLLFLILAVFLLRYFYNQSIPKMSDQHKEIQTREAIHLAGFLWIAGLFFNVASRRDI